MLCDITLVGCLVGRSVGWVLKWDLTMIVGFTLNPVDSL